MESSAGFINKSTGEMIVMNTGTDLANFYKIVASATTSAFTERIFSLIHLTGRKTINKAGLIKSDLLSYLNLQLDSKNECEMFLKERQLLHNAI